MEGTAAAPFSGAPSADPLTASLSSQWREAGRKRQRRNAAAAAGESSASAVEGPAICMTRCAAATDDPPEAGGPGGYRSGSVCRARTGAIGAGRPTRRRRLSRCRAPPGHRPRTAGGRALRPCVNGGGIMHHAERSGGPVAAAQNCATHGPLSVATRGRRCTAWSSMRRFDWRLSTRG